MVMGTEAAWVTFGFESESSADAYDAGSLLVYS